MMKRFFKTSLISFLLLIFINIVIFSLASAFNLTYTEAAVDLIIAYFAWKFADEVTS